MPKSKRLMELIVAVNRKRTFTVKELAREFGVSPRTIMRDLQELGELGVPLYSEVGPHGGYRVLRERLLPPIAFTEAEAVAIFFASRALRHYAQLPFEAETSSALAKFYTYLPSDVRERIDRMTDRFDFFTPPRTTPTPHLSVLLDAAVRHRTLRVEYASKSGVERRDIQPIGVYASGGFWYVPAYCFLRGDVRLFRCDRIASIVETDPPDAPPIDLGDVHLGNWRSFRRDPSDDVELYAELTKEGVSRCEAELWPSPKLYVRPDGSGWLEGPVPRNDLPYFARFFIGLGLDASVIRPTALVDAIRRTISALADRYR